MGFKPVILATDALLFLLLAIVLGAMWRARHSEPVRAAWREVGRSSAGMAAATLLAAYLVVGLLDSLHYRPALPPAPGATETVYSGEVLSTLDAMLSGLRSRTEKTYSAPLADTLYSKETVDLPDGQQARIYPPLKFAATQLAKPATELESDVLRRAGHGLLAGLAGRAVTSCGSGGSCWAGPRCGGGRRSSPWRAWRWFPASSWPWRRGITSSGPTRWARTCCTSPSRACGRRSSSAPLRRSCCCRWPSPSG